MRKVSYYSVGETDLKEGIISSIVHVMFHKYLELELGLTVHRK